MRCDVCFACKPDKAARRSEIRACLSLTGTGNEYVTQAVRFENRYNLSFKYQNDQSWVRNDREMECIYDKLLPINMKLDGLANQAAHVPACLLYDKRIGRSFTLSISVGSLFQLQIDVSLHRYCIFHLVDFMQPAFPDFAHRSVADHGDVHS